MKIKKLFFVIITVAASAVIMFSCGKDSKWVAKIKGDTIPLGMFNSLYYAQQKQIYNDTTNEAIDKRAANPEEVQKNPTLDKKEFLENLVRQRLVYLKAVDEGTLKNKEVEALIEMAKEAVVTGYYVKEKFKDQVEVTEPEIAKVYSEQKDRFKGVSIEQAEQYIRQNIMNQKLQLKIRDFVEILKEEGGIKRNLDLIAKKDDSSQKEKTDVSINKDKKGSPKIEAKSETGKK